MEIILLIIILTVALYPTLKLVDWMWDKWLEDDK